MKIAISLIIVAGLVVLGGCSKPPAPTTPPPTEIPMVVPYVPPPVQPAPIIPYVPTPLPVMTISNATVDNIYYNTATITLNTNMDALVYATVHYPYGSSVGVFMSDSKGTAHSIFISGLRALTTYKAILYAESTTRAVIEFEFTTGNFPPFPWTFGYYNYYNNPPPVDPPHSKPFWSGTIQVEIIQ
jgi:hypothetical protein